MARNLTCLLLPFRYAAVPLAPANAALCLDLRVQARVIKKPVQTKMKQNYRLQLCDNYGDTSYTPGSVRCRNINYCKGAATGTGNADNCYPKDLWTGIRYGDGLYHGQAMANGEFNYKSCGGKGYCPSTLAFSVARCVFGFENSLFIKF